MAIDVNNCNFALDLFHSFKEKQLKRQSHAEMIKKTLKNYRRMKRKTRVCGKFHADSNKNLLNNRNISFSSMRIT